jgi:hypothetical protein
VVSQAANARFILNSFVLRMRKNLYSSPAFERPTGPDPFARVRYTPRLAAALPLFVNARDPSLPQHVRGRIGGCPDLGKIGPKKKTRGSRWEPPAKSPEST